jgi:hypothetical protein
VTVYRLVAAHTIEEQIYLRQVYKEGQTAVGVYGTDEKRLFKGVAKDPKNRGELYGMLNMFTARNGKLRTELILEREKSIAAALRAAGVRPWSADDATDDEDDDPVEEAGGAGDEDDALARKLMRANRRAKARDAREGHDAEDPVQEADESDDEDARPVLGHQGLAGAVYGHNHAEMRGPGAVEPLIAAQARAALLAVAPQAAAPPVARQARMRAVVPEAGVPVPEAALTMMAGHFGMPLQQLAQQMMDGDRLMRDNLVEQFLTANRRRRGE